MTRFDTALQQFAKDAEAPMRDRVGSVGNRYATVQEVGRGRGRRLALQSLATVAAVAVLGAGTWLVAGQLRSPAPAGPAVEPIRYLGDPVAPEKTAITCGVPLPVSLDAGVTTASAGQEVPRLSQRVQVTDANGTRAADVSPGVTTVPSEDGLGVRTTAVWEGKAPQFWGITDYAVLVDADGNVVARAVAEDGTGVVDATSSSAFFANSCTDWVDENTVTGPEFLDGPHRLHVITQLWVDNRRNPVVQWVDEGLPAGASVTVDHAALLALQQQQVDAADALFQQVKGVIADAGGTLATVDGPAVVAAVSPCALDAALAAVGTAGVAAMPASLPSLEVTWTPQGLSWSGQGSDYDDAYDLAVAFFDSHGKYTAMSVARPHSTTSEADGTVTTSVWFANDESAIIGACPDLGVPTEPGTYDAYVVFERPGFDPALAPASLRELGDFANLSAWVPVGHYVVP